MNRINKNMISDWTFKSSIKYRDPFNETELDVYFFDEKNNSTKVPAFWAGGDSWKVRFASPETGKFKFRTVCSDKNNSGLHEIKGEFEVHEYDGENIFYVHGPIKVSSDKRHFMHYDETPFFWLADTLWMGFCKRLKWPEEFLQIVSDRSKKGFNVIQIVAGLYPDMHPFDERGANEFGFPWKSDYSCIQPEYFDLVDERIEGMVNAGMSPCIVLCWGFHLGFMGKKGIKQHMRYVLARYGAYPVTWCMAGEAIMPYYLDPESKDMENFFPKARKDWTELTKYFHSIQAFKRPISIHCIPQTSDMLEDNNILDFMMLQTGHMDIISFPNTVETIRTAMNKNELPVLNSEVCYENIIGLNHDDIQRMMFWVCVLLGAAGHTYGANGMWQINSRDILYGPSPSGECWGVQTWQDAYKLPGSYHVGVGKKILSRYKWNKIVYHPEWIERKKRMTAFTDEFENFFIPYAAGIEGVLRIIYLNPFFLGDILSGGQTIVKNLEKCAKYKAYRVDPRTGEDYEIGEVFPDSDGNWIIPDKQPYLGDWIVTLEADGCRINV